MATTEQFQQLIDLFKTQVEENRVLRETSNGQQATQDATQSTPRVNGQTRKSKSKKPDRPIIDASIDDRDWALFRDSWSRYKLMCELQDMDVASIRLELRACCSTEVNKLLFEYVGTTVLNACSEEELLNHIRSIAVKSVHKEVHRMSFNTMSQEKGESITQFVARLKSKAFLCQFVVVCTSCNPHESVSYAEDMVGQRLVAGLFNPEHQRRVLSEAASLTSLDLKIKRLQILESTEESATLLHPPAPPAEVAACRSSYKRGQSQPREATNEASTGEAKKCRWCGLTSHPRGKPMDHVNCPAYKKVCHRCHTKGHFGRVCEKSETSVANTGELENDRETSPSDASVSFSFGMEAQQDFRMRNMPNDWP